MESKTSLVFTQMNPPIKVFSKGSTVSACVGSAIIALDRYRWMQPLSELAEVHFRTLCGNLLIISVGRFSKILHRIMVS